MKNLEIKERFNKIKQDIENGKLYLEKYNKETFSEVYQKEKPKNLPKIIYRFFNNYMNRFEIELMLFNFKGYHITIFIGTNFKISYRKKPKRDKRNRFREVEIDGRILLLEKIHYHKNLYDLKIITDYKMSYLDEDILSFFKTENTEDFELILLKIVKELILKKELKEVV